MAVRQPVPTAFGWKNRVMIELLDTEYWWNYPSNILVQLLNMSEGEITFDNIISAPLRESLQLQVDTQFQELINLTPFSSVFESVQNVTTLLGKGLGGPAKYTEVSIWKKTSPLTLNFKLHFDSDLWAFTDVYLPAIALLGYTVPEEQAGNLLKTPGANLQNLNEISQGLTNDFQSAFSKSRLCSLMIGGWFYINNAVLTKAIPEFSNNITDSGYPLWVDMDIEIKTLEITTVQLLTGMVKDVKSNNLLSGVSFNG